jgi:hypothetical protein
MTDKKELAATRQQAISLGQSAKRVLGEEAWKFIYTDTMDMIFNGFLSVAPGDIETLKDINQSGRALHKVQNKLEGLADIADSQIQEGDK